MAVYDLIGCSDGASFQDWEGHASRTVGIPTTFLLGGGRRSRCECRVMLTDVRKQSNFSFAFQGILASNPSVSVDGEYDPELKRGTLTTHSVPPSS